MKAVRACRPTPIWRAPWYAAAGLLAAQERLTEVKSPAGRPASVRAPEPLFPAKAGALEPGSQKVDLVWTSAIEPEAVRYFVELRLLDAGTSREVWSGLRREAHESRRADASRDGVAALEGLAVGIVAPLWPRGS
jgi:hypothetical protein